MNINQILLDLHSEANRDETLNLLSQIVVDTDSRLINSIREIIKDPESIENTNSFASLIDAFPDQEFIQPLIDCIGKGEPTKTPWLSDYMYALGSILMEQDESWVPQESFVHLLGKWLLSTGGGEIAWKAAVILSELSHPTTLQYFIDGAKDNNIFHQARNACIAGLINHYPEESLKHIKPLTKDEEKEVREEAERAVEWIKNLTNKDRS